MSPERRVTYLSISTSSESSACRNRGGRFSFQDHEGGHFADIALAHAVRRLDQVGQFCRRVVRGDASGAMTEEILPVLERHSRRSQPPA